MVQIIPAILATSEEQFGRDIYKLSQSESLKSCWVHIDFADNIFVQNKTVGVETVRKFPTDFKKEAHLMVSHPREWIDKLVDGGFERIIFHIEAKDDADEVIDYIKSKGKEVGLAIKEDTTVDKLTPFISKIDVVLIMSIVAGLQGQKFIPETLNKIKECSRLRLSNNLDFLIGIDGGVSVENVKLVTDTGVDFFVSGSHLLDGDIEENLENFWEAING